LRENNYSAQSSEKACHANSHSVKEPTTQDLTKPKGLSMLWTIIVILLVLWLLGLIGHIGGSLIHLLLVIAVVVLIINLIQGRRGV
jgi:fatty acid desaturase